MARPQGPASPALRRSQQPWAPNLPGGPPLTVMASLGKGHVAGFMAAGTAVGVGEGSEAQGRGGRPPHVAAAGAGLHLRTNHSTPSTWCLDRRQIWGPACFPAHPSPGHRGRQSLCDGVKEGVG